MGVDTKLYINRDWTVQDVRDVLKNRLGIETKTIFHDWAPDYVVLRFPSKYEKCDRLLHVHTKTHVAGFPAMGLDFRSNPEGIGILRVLAETFGGLFQEQDVTEDFQAFQKPGHGNIDFVLKEAVKKEPELAENIEQMAQFIVEGKWRNK